MFRRIAYMTLCLTLAAMLSGCVGWQQSLYNWASGMSHSIQDGCGPTHSYSMRTSEQLERDGLSGNGQPAMKIVNCSVSASELKAGEQVIITAVYQASGKCNAPPSGKMQIFRKGEKKMIAEKRLDNIDRAGEVKISQPLKFPPAAKSGNYSIAIVLNYGGSEAKETVTLTVK